MAILSVNEDSEIRIPPKYPDGQWAVNFIFFSQLVLQFHNFATSNGLYLPILTL